MLLGLHRVFRRRLAAWWTLAIGLLVTAAIGWELHREARELDRQRLARRVTELQAQLDARLEKSEMLLNNLRDRLTRAEESRDLAFARWCHESGISSNCPWILGVAVATNRNVAYWRESLPNPPATWTTHEWETFKLLARRQVIDCELALTSEDRSGRQFRSDYGLQRLIRERDVLSRIFQMSRLGMSEHRFVMMGARGKRIMGTLYFAPVYEPELAEFLSIEGLDNGQIGAARWLHLNSLILAPVDFKTLVESVWDEVPADLGLELFSSTTQTAETWLNAGEGTPRAADPTFKPCLTHQLVWPMYQHRFSIFFYTTPLFEAQSPRRLAKVAMAGGTILTLVATALVAMALGARGRQERLTGQIREARDALAAAQKERNRVSHDLHDGTIQSLYAIQLGLGQTIQRIEAEPVRAGSELSALRRELDTIIAEIRQFITADVGADQAVDFAAVLRTLVRRAQAGTDADIHQNVEPGAMNRLSPTQAIQLANITREALSNSLRHGRPRRVTVSLRTEGKTLVLVVSDDGTGFNPKAPPRTGVGLASMTARAREADGSFEIQSSPGAGARVTVHLPVSESECAKDIQSQNTLRGA